MENIRTIMMTISEKTNSDRQKWTSKCFVVRQKVKQDNGMNDRDIVVLKTFFLNQTKNSY